MSRRRTTKLKQLRRVIWLVVEGDTELHYLTGLKNDPDRPKPNPPVKTNIRCARGKCPRHVVRAAVNLRRAQVGKIEGHEFYCVFDVEDNTPPKRAALSAALSDAKANKFNVVLSNPCFEVWLHCHLEGFTPRAFISCSECVSSLKSAWVRNQVSPQPYAKGDNRIYEKLARNLDVAVSTARVLREVHHRNADSTVDANASTEVYRLIEFLHGVRSTFSTY